MAHCNDKPTGADVYFGTKESFKSVQRDRRRRLLRGYWNRMQLSDDNKQIVANMINERLNKLDPPHGNIQDILRMRNP